MNRLARQSEHPSTEDLCEWTKQAVHREKAHRKHESRQAVSHWKHAAEVALRWVRSRAHYQDHINIATTEHMSSVDAHDGKQMRTSSTQNAERSVADEDLLVVNPRVDGRFDNVGRE